MAKSRMYIEQELSESFSSAITLALNLLDKNQAISKEDKEEISEKIAKVQYSRKNLID